MKYEIIERPFSVKAEDVGDDGIFKGYGSTFGGKGDFGGDIIDERAFSDTIRKDGKFGTGIAMLLQHDHQRPIGKWLNLTENTKGLSVTGQLALKTKDGAEAYEFMKLGILNALSIGWEPLKINSEGDSVRYEDAIEWDEKTRIRHLKKIDLWEISPVLFPMNPKARIDEVKTAIESAKTVRELEHALKESGLSNNAAKYITSLCKNNLHLEDDDRNELGIILKRLRILNAEHCVSTLLSKAKSSQRDAELIDCGLNV